MVASLLGDLATAISIGLFLDLLLVDRKRRTQLRQYLNSDHNPVSIGERLQKFLTLSHAIVFGRYFAHPALTTRFFASAAVVSLTSFIIVSALQVYFYPSEFLKIDFNYVQVLLILSFVIFNLLFDYFTIVQTRYFLEAAISNSSTFRILLFVFSDLLVTINTFILAFAVFTLLVAQAFIAPEKNLQLARYGSGVFLEQRLTKLPDDLSQFSDSSAFSRLSTYAYLDAILFDPMNSSDVRSITLPVVATFRPSELDTHLLVVRASSKLDLVASSPFEAVNGEPDQFILDGLKSSTFWKLGNEGQENLDTVPIVELSSISVSGRIRSIADLDIAYTSAFGQVDSLEDGFPGSVFGSLQFIWLSTFISDAMSLERDLDRLVVCLDEEGNATRFVLTEATVSLLSGCSDFVLVEFIFRRSLNSDLATLGRGVDDKVVPYNTLFITSLLPTVLFYLIVVLMVVSTRLYAFTLARAARFSEIILRAPLTIACVILGIPMSFLGWL